MYCHRCKRLLPAGATGCPHCEQDPPHTRRLKEIDLHKTRALVLIERCENCGWIVYPNDSECSACGTWVNRPWKQTSSPAKARKSRASRDAYRASRHDAIPQDPASPPNGKRVWVGVAISMALLCLTALAWHFLTAPHLQ